MWLSTHYFSGLLQDWFHVFLYEINKKKSVWYNFYQGTSVSITFYIFEHYQLWMMDSKAQRVFFPKTPKLCVWHTEVRSCYHFKLVSHFQLWFPIWGVLVNRLPWTKLQISGQLCKCSYMQTVYLSTGSSCCPDQYSSDAAKTHICVIIYVLLCIWETHMSEIWRVYLWNGVYN